MFMLSKELSVEIFVCDRCYRDLTEKINEWLNKNDVEVVDIKYQLVANSVYNCDLYSAMILYKKA